MYECVCTCAPRTSIESVDSCLEFCRNELSCKLLYDGLVWFAYSFAVSVNAKSVLECSVTIIAGDTDLHLYLYFTDLGTCRAKKTWPKSFSQEELRKRLTPMQYHVTQEKGTER